MLVNAVATFVVASPAGRLIDRIGERRSMTIYYLAIALAFLGYAVTNSVGPLKVLYVMDNILFSLGVSITTYLNRIVRPGELMPSLSMGQTMNHVAAVAIPVTGGLLWTRFGYHAPFWAGVIAALISLGLTQFVRALRSESRVRELPRPGRCSDGSLGRRQTMADKKIALITGANKGIGKEIARQLGAQGMTVLIGARDEGAARRPPAN